MTKKTIDKYLSLVTSTEEQADGRRRLYHVGDRFTVEVTRCTCDNSSPRSLMNIWKKAGYIPAVLPSYLCINTYFTDVAGNCWGRYNITVKPSDDGRRQVLNFDYLREATPENERELVAECIRLMVAGTGYHRDLPRIHHPCPTGLHYDGQDNNDRPIIIDAAELSPGVYEIMALRPGGDELETRTVYTLREAEDTHKAMVARYTTSKPEPKPAAPLTGKYAKLRDDLRQALAAGRAAEDANPEDGGTCNFDACRLYLPRWSAAKVEQAAEEAGTSCFVWRLFGGSRYVFAPNSHAQANARSRNAEAMTKALRDLGYDALDYCAMD